MPYTVVDKLLRTPGPRMNPEQPLFDSSNLLCTRGWGFEVQGSEERRSCPFGLLPPTPTGSSSGFVPEPAELG